VETNFFQKIEEKIEKYKLFSIFQEKD